MELKKLNTLIKGLRTRRDSNRQAIQVVAVACIEHANETGDCTPAMRAVRAIESRLRSQVKAYFGLYSPILVTIGKTVNDDKCRFRKEDQDGYNAFNVEGAKANMWWEVGVEKTVKPLTLTTFRESIQNVLKKYNKALEDGNITEADAEGIRADMAALHETVQANGAREATPAMAAQTEEQPNVGGERLAGLPEAVVAEAA